MDKLEDALRITEQYRDDTMPSTVYGKALALFKLGALKESNPRASESYQTVTTGSKEPLKKQAPLAQVGEG